MHTKAKFRISIAIGVFGVIALCVVGYQKDRNRKRLSSRLEWPLPESIAVRAEHGSFWEKDAVFYWSLSHPPHALDTVLRLNYRVSDQADSENIQRELAGVFSNLFSASKTDLVYGKEGVDYDIFILIKNEQTESYVIVFHK